MDPDVICDFKLTNRLIACLKISVFIIIYWLEIKNFIKWKFVEFNKFNFIF